MSTASSLSTLPRRALRVGQLLTAVVLLAYAVATIFPGLCPTGWEEFFARTVYPLCFVMAGLLAIGRAVADRHGQVAWAGIGMGLIAWAAAEKYVDFAFPDDVVPNLSFADALWAVFYLSVYVGVTLLVRARTRDFRASLWLDGVVGILALGAVAVAIVLGPVLANPDPGMVANDLAYFGADLLLLAVVVGAFAVCGWRPGRDLGMLGGGLIALATVDAFAVWQGAANPEFASLLPTVGWPVAGVVAGFAAWQAVPQVARVRVEGLRVVALPAGFALIALGVLVTGAFTDVHPVAFALAGLALLAAIGRMSMTFSENVKLLHRTRYQAYTDALTGLENRRKLMVDLEEALPEATAEHPVAVALFDLDGFKQYNDSFGHPAGDALLARLGSNLKSAVDGLGSAYRLGGDEFCVLTKGDEPLMRALIEEARLSLAEEGEAFSVASSCGLVIIPREATDTSGALNVADERLYDHKGERKRASVTRQTSDALVQVVREREPALGEHQTEVARLARAVGRQMGLEDGVIDQLGRAGELHDIGKVAIPDAILSKPGPLDELEWGLVRQHTLVGERIVAAAPMLAPVAELVRGSHERFDGGGYPDGLVGEQIPLGSRIVSACDAYHVMICERPYRQAVSSTDALEELRRCAGGQFDPGVVEAICELMQQDSGAERFPQPAA